MLGTRVAEVIAVGRAFQDLGFDSLTAVELRNRLSAATGLAPARHAGLRLPDADGPRRASRRASSPAGRGTTVAALAPRNAGAEDEPIAIVGMSCRFPGGVRGPEELWRLVADGERRVTAFPADRGWDLDGLYDPDPDRPGTILRRARAASSTTRRSSTPGSSGSRPREALAMDPQQRLLLETSWEAFERAGIDPETLARQRHRRVRRRRRPGLRATWPGPPTMLEGYLAHRHRGQRDVRPGRPTPRPRGPGGDGRHRVLVVAGGAAPGRAGAAAGRVRAGAGRRRDRDVDPGAFVEFSRQRGLAPDGRCKAFAAAADGTAGRGRRPAPAGAAVRRAAQRPPGAGGGAGLRGEPGRRVATG